jgi:hypothetical protein
VTHGTDDDAAQLNAAGHAVMQQYLTAMSSQEVMKRKLTIADFVAYVEELPTEWMVRLCGFLECLRDEPERLGIDDIQIHALGAFVPAIAQGHLITHYKATGNRFLFEEQLLGLIRFAILNGQNDAPPILTAEQRRAFFWALIGYGDLHSDEIGALEEGDHAARMELRGLAFSASEVPGNVMARAYALWLDIAARPEFAKSPYFIDVPNEFAHATGGATIADYLTIVSVLLTHRGDAVKDEVFASLSRWRFDPVDRFSSSARAAELTATMRAFAGDRAQLQEIFTKEMPPTPQFLGVAMVPFIHRPLYATADGKFLIISMRLVIDGLHDVAYWRIWEHLKLDHGADGAALPQRFTQFYGQILERYVVELLRSVYDTNGTKRVFAEAEAKPSEGAADAAVFLDDRVILIDVTKTDLQYFKTLLQGDLASFNADFARTAEKVAQLAKAEQRFKAGQVRYPGHEADNMLSVERIVVVPNPIPRFPFINEHTAAALKKVGLSPDTTIISVGELEEALVAGDLQGLSTTIAAWKESELAGMALHNYIRLKQPVIPMEKRAPYINTSAEKMRKLVIERMAFTKPDSQIAT